MTAEQAEEVEKRTGIDWLKINQTDIEACEDFLMSINGRVLVEDHHFVIKVKSHLVMLYSIRSTESDTKIEVLEHRLRLCQDVIRYLARIDPEETKKMGVFLLEMNDVRMKLTKTEAESGSISRMQFLKRLAEGARVEVRAKKMLGC